MIPENFHFLRPEWLLGAALWPVFLILARRRGRSAGAWQRACDADLLEHLLTKGGGARSMTPAVLLAIGWLVGCLAMAGPSWERLPQATYDEPTDTVAVLSLTPSLHAQDLPPSRLDRARFELEDLLGRAEGTVGLVIVAEQAYPVTPLTADARVIQEMIPVLEPELMPGRGARLDRGIDEALSLLDNAGARAGRIVLITDGPGEAPERAIAAAKGASEAGHVVSVLALADDAGAEIARAGGGVYVPVRADDGDVERVLAAGGAALAPLEELRAGSVEADVWRDMGPWFLLLPLALAPLAFRRGWATALAVLLALGLSAAPEPAMAAVGDWFARADQQGAASFEEGRHDEAAARFEDPEWQGVAAYRSGDFGAAVEALEGVASGRARYNLGNALAHAGELEAAIAAYDEVLQGDADHEDARHNRDLLQELLDQQQQQQEQQQPQQGDASDSQGSEGSESGEDAEDSGSEGSEGSGGSESGADGNPSAGTDAGAGEQEAADQAGESGESSSESGKENAGAEPSSDASGSDTASGSESEDGATDPAANAGSGGEEESESQTANADGASPGGQAEDPGEPSRGEASGASGDPSSSDPSATEHASRGSGGGDEGERGENEPADSAEPGAPGDESPDGTPVASPAAPMSERDQEMEHMLSRVPDDPGGLLREKLRRRYVEKQGLHAAGRGGR